MRHASGKSHKTRDLNNVERTTDSLFYPNIDTKVPEVVIVRESQR